MKKTLTAGAALLLTTTQLSALGLDRSGQPIGIIFENGSYAELSFGYVMPEVSGNDLAPFGTTPSGNVAEDYGVLGLGYKRDINSELSFAIIIDEPYGADVVYPSAADGGSVALGGTEAELNSLAVTSLLRYKFDENISVHGGIRVQSVDANVTLDGLAYGAAAGYNVDLARDTRLGYTVGAAYEVPDIALRVALTYVSEIEHEFDTTDFVGDTTTTVTTPQAVNLDFQTGVAADTLVFGSIRWAEYSKVIVAPAGLGGSSLTDIDDGFAYTLGIGRRFSDQFSGSVSVGYEPEGDDLVSPLSPSNGNISLALGGKYTVGNVEYSGGVRYIKLGDASAQTADTARAEFNDNDAIAVGFKVGYRF